MDAQGCERGVVMLPRTVDDHTRSEGRGSAEPAVLSVLPYAVMALVAVANLIAGPTVGLLPLVSLGPAFAGLVGGWRRTARPA